MTIDRKKEPSQSRKWALVTLHPWLPSRAEQIARARTWGVEESTLNGHDISALFVDDVRKVGRTTNWNKYLTDRARLFEVMAKLQYRDDQVFFANPLCVGFSEKHAEASMRALWDARLAVYVHAVKDNGSALYRAGDDLGDFLESVRLLANAKHQSAYRARQSE